MTPEEFERLYINKDWPEMLRQEGIQPIESMVDLINSAPPEGSLPAHRKAEAFMANADRFWMLGAEAAAKEAWRHAARWEMETFQQIPDIRPRTRGITAVSAVALAKRSGDMTLARQYAVMCAQKGVPEWAAETMHEILDP